VEFVEQWQGRVGREAANLSVTAARAVGVGGLLVPVWGALFVVAGDRPILLALATLLAVVDVVALAIGILLTSRRNALLSQRFGTKVWCLNSPSLQEGRFQSWCGRNGVNAESGAPA
jgi:hypothetical protein